MPNHSDAPPPGKPHVHEPDAQRPQFDGMGRIDGRELRPYVMVDREVIQLLDPDELALYVVLLTFLRGPEAMTSRECWPSHETLAGVYGRSVDAVQRVMRKLADRGLVVVTRQGKTRPNRYRLAGALPGDAADLRSHSGGDAAESRPRDTADLRSRDAAESRHEVEVVEVEEPKETNLPPDPPAEPAPARAAPAEPPGREGGGIAALPEDQQRAYRILAGITARTPRLVVGEQELLHLLPYAVPWLDRSTPQGMEAALTNGLPQEIGNPAGLLRMRLEKKLPPEKQDAATRNGLPRWCGQCGDGNPAAEHNPRFRRVPQRDGPDALCEACHPDRIAQAA